MTAEVMGRLYDGQRVVLDLGEEAIDCRVRAAGERGATLAPVSAADAAYIPSLGRAAALVFEARGTRVRVEGTVRRGPGEGLVRFVLEASTRLPPRRRAPRVATEIAVALTPVTEEGAHAGGPHRTVTADVGLGGIGVRVESWSPPVGALVAFALELPAGAPVEGTARVLRVENGVAGLELVNVAPVDRARIAAFLIRTRTG